jgi:acetylornithine deacetylase/succinyl-diaminopimelate desuccinylase-like protein
MMTPELQDLFTFLSFPSVSTDSKHKSDVLDCAGWLMEKISGMGLETQLHETPGHPIVTAKNKHLPDRKTVLIYGHYDVQPADPLNLWDTPPFAPEIRNGKIWARGATDNKGQMLAHILGIEKTLAEKGELPVNLILLFEGEEEIGSPSLAPFLEKNSEFLKCDIIAISDTGMVAPNTGTLGYGLRGVACAEVKLTGPARDLHSGLFGGAVANPATAIARLVASLHLPDGTVAIEGFYDAVRPLEAWEREM